MQAVERLEDRTLLTPIAGEQRPEAIHDEFSIGFDFGVPGSLVEPGYRDVGPATVFNPIQGFGWEDVTGLDGRDRGLSDALTTDYALIRHGAGTFLVDIPADGEYDVSVTVGSAANSRDRVGILLDGTQVTEISTARNEFVTESFRVTVSNGQLAVGVARNGGTGASINALYVAQVGDGPQVSLSTTPQFYRAGDPATPIDPDLRVTDPDNSNLIGATVAITGGFDPDDRLDYTTVNGITGSYDQATGVLTLSGTATAADYQSALRTVAYRNANAATSAGGRTITVTAQDAGDSGSATRDITVVGSIGGDLKFDFGTESAPASSVESGYNRVHENLAFNFAAGFGWLDPGIESRDRSAPNALRQDYNLIRHGAATFGVVVANGLYDVILTMGSTANNRDRVGILLEGTQVGQLSTDVGEFTTPTWRVAVSDNRLDVGIARLGSTAASINALEITPATNAPVVTPTASALVYPAGDPAAVIDAGLIIIDPNDSDITGATVTIGSGYNAAEDSLQFTAQNGITVDTNTDGVLTLTGTASVAEYQAALRRVTYLNTNSSATASTREITFAVTDADGTGSGSRALFIVEPFSGRAAYDFGTGTSPVEPNFTGVSESSAFDAGLGYGWLDTTVVESRDRGVPTDVRRDYNLVRHGSGTFAVGLPNGDYSVTVTAGSSANRRDNVGISLEDTLVAILSTQPGEFETRTWNVSVDDSRLDVQLERLGSTGAGINSLVIQSVGSPALQPVGNRTAEEGTELRFVLVATDPDLPNDTLTYSLGPGAPDGATVDPGTGIFQWTPTELQGGQSYDVTLQVADQGGLTDSETITVDVAETNQPPVVTAFENPVVEEGSQLTFAIPATDPDLPSNDLTYEFASGAPAGATLDAQTGVFTWTPDTGQGPGFYNIAVRVTDDGSPAMETVIPFQVEVTESVLVLHEGSGLVTEQFVSVDLGQAEGTRTLRVEVAPLFDTTDSLPALEDIFLISLVDSTDASQTILDRGTPGTALFTLAGTNADFVPGPVRWDGRFVDIDVTSLASLSTGRLKFQLINSDADAGTRIHIVSIANELDPDGTVGPAFPVNATLVGPGPVQDLTGFSAATDVELTVGNVRLDSGTGRYIAELRLHNKGPAIGRQIAAVFPGLPADVTLLNASGTDAAGNPYINFAPAVPPGGLSGGATSDIIEVTFDDPTLRHFALTPAILTSGPNQAPQFDPVSPLSVHPGGFLEVQLNASDPDGDNVSYQIRSDSPLPTGTLHGDGRLTFSPVPSDIGSYQLQLVATDGAEQATQEVTLTVQADLVTTTRISGVILDTNESPLAGIPIEIGPLQTTTAADGSFQLETDGALPADTLIVRGELLVGAASYPFIAEKLTLLFGRDVIDNVDNVIPRPIYLPALDTAQAQTINPAQDTTVAVPLTAGEAPAEVFVAAGTLEDQQGNPFTGELSITEVPRDRTPAALPDGLLPDVVVTIQPGEMVFTTPAPLTLPNRAGFPAGTVMDLWSINPVTGDFEIVGTAAVSADGTVIETTSGGIRNSSWHFTLPPVPEPTPNNNNPSTGCSCPKGKQRQQGTSEVELHSGALLENHDLATYQSLGTTRGIRLQYDSERADARPIVHFGFNNVPDDTSLRLIASLSISADNFEFPVQGTVAGSLGLTNNEHFWAIPSGGGDIEAALQADLSDQPTGVYDYTLRSGALPARFVTGGATLVNGSRTIDTGRLAHVNLVDSPFGAGWSIDGLQQVVESPQGPVLLADGGGLEFLFLPPANSGEPYSGPAGDFSTFEKLGDGTFRRTMKNQTVYQFDPAGRLALMTDRNGNRTEYAYDVAGRLVRITDPAGLEILFAYTDDRATAITDPAGRLTTLEYDTDGNLIRITDPDETFRSFQYDDAHRMIGEIDKRGFSESAAYDFAGRVVKVTRKDGSEQFFSPAQTQALLPPGSTLDVENAPDAFRVTPVESFSTDPNGDVTRTTLDTFGLRVDSRDEFGFIGTDQRDDNVLLTRSTNGRGQVTTFQYDANGNVVEIRDELSVLDLPLPTPFPGPIFAANPGSGLSAVAAFHDVNADGLPDLILPDNRQVEVRLADGSGGYSSSGSFAFTFGSGGVRQFAFGEVTGDSHVDIFVLGLIESAVLPGNGDGTFGAKQFVSLPGGTDSIGLGEVTGDGRLDLVTSSFNVSQASSARTTIYEGDGAGGFAFHSEFNAPGTIGNAKFADVNSDGHLDIVSRQGFHQISGITPAVRIRLGDGTGNFTAAQTFGVRRSPNAVAVGLIDGDTIPDIVTASEEDLSLSILIGVGDGTFVAQPRIVLNDNPTFVEIVDMTEDGISDLVATFRGGGVVVLPGAGDGIFGAAVETAAGDTTGQAAIGDTNGDGKPDLVMGNSSQNVVLLHGLGTGGFAGQFEHNIGRTAKVGTVGDIDGDRIPDIITANDDGTVTVLPGVGDGTFLADVNFPIASESLGVAAADINADGFDDIIASNRNADTVSVLSSNGDGTFAPHVQHNVGDSPRQLAAIDVNNDGHVDMVVLNFTDNSISTLLGDGTGAFPTRLDHALTNDLPRGLAFGEFNGDSNIDLIVGSGGSSIFSTNGEISILTGNGDGTWNFVAASDKATGKTPRSIRVVDFNNDDQPDVVTLNADQIMVFPGNGDGTLGNRIDIVPNTFISNLAVGDVSGDGNADILVGSGFNSVLIYDGDGQFGFTHTGTFATASLAHWVETADFDGNQQLDFVAFSVDNTSLNSPFVSPRLQGFTTLGTRPVARTFAYDSVFNQVISETDELGRQTLFDIDPVTGNVLSTTQVVGDAGGPDDVVTTFTYAATGQVETVTGPLGRVTEFEYDTLGRLITTTVAMGTADEGITRFEYDAAGNLTASIDENTNRTEFEYDELNRLTLTRDALNNITTFTYDGAGNLQTTTDARGNPTTNHYDELSRLTSTVNALNLTTTFRYDNVGNLLSTNDPLGYTTTNRYDSRDRLEATIDPNGGVTGFRYDADDNLRVVTDPVGNVTTFVHDARDRVIREIDPLGASTFFTYDVADNLIRKLDRNLRVTEFTYDDLDRPTNELWINEDGTTANEIVNTYDRVSNLLTAVDNFSSLTFTYDNRDRVLTTDNAGTPLVPGVVLTYTYDAVGNVLSVADSVEGSAGGTTTYAYDDLNRVEQIRQFGNNVSDKRVDFSYNELGQYATLTRYFDFAGTQPVVTTTYTYDNLNRLNDIRHNNSTTEFAFYEYEYDDAGRISQIVDIDGTTDYTYDKRSQLTAADHTDTGNPDETYEYDANGNRVSSHLHGEGYVIGDGNRPGSDGKYTYLYDAEGNRIQRVEIATNTIEEYKWDHLNRLVSVRKIGIAGAGITETTFAYDVFSQRVLKSVDDDASDSSPGITTAFVYDGGNVQLEAVDGDLIRYMHGPAIDMVLSQDNSAASMWTLTDHLFTVRDTVSLLGNVQNHIRYSSFGQVISETSPAHSPRVGFTGRENDSELDLMYYRARFYDPALGQFISEDPIGFMGTDPNLRRYVSNSPVVFVDPLGLCECSRRCPPTWNGGVPPNGWRSYRDGSKRRDAGAKRYHCGFNVLLEICTADPKAPQNECAYDDNGMLVTANHEFAGCRGTPNQYDGDINPIRHWWSDDGGIRKRGREAREASRRYERQQRQRADTEVIPDVIADN